MGYLPFKRKKQEQNGVWGQGRERERERVGEKNLKVFIEILGNK